MFRSIRNEKGAAGIEYALLISLVSLAIVGGLQALGDNLNDILSYLEGALSSLASDTPPPSP